MGNDDRIVRVIYEAIDEINRSLDRGQALDRSPDTVLIGESGLDSLAFVNFAVAVEEKLGRVCGRPPSVFDLVSGEELDRWTVADLAQRIAAATGGDGATG